MQSGRVAEALMLIDITKVYVEYGEPSSPLIFSATPRLCNSALIIRKS